MTSHQKYARIARFCRLDKQLTDAYRNGSRPSAGLKKLRHQAWLALPENVKGWIR